MECLFIFEKWDYIYFLQLSLSLYFLKPISLPDKMPYSKYSHFPRYVEIFASPCFYRLNEYVLYREGKKNKDGRKEKEIKFQFSRIFRDGG